MLPFYFNSWNFFLKVNSFRIRLLFYMKILHQKCNDRNVIYSKKEKRML